MPEAQQDPWGEVLKEALQTGNGKPIVGTKFRQAVNSAASLHEMHFPPVDEPRLRFIEFLERYPTVVSILRRPGQDFLIAPADKADILADSVQDRTFIRRDFFAAFTIVSKAARSYNKAIDQVVWSGSSDVPGAEGLISIPAPSEEDEVDLRRQFLNKIGPDSEVGKILLKSLSEPLPLQAFGKAVKENGMHKQWHSFRTARILDKIQTWAGKNGLEWKDAWLMPTFFRNVPDLKLRLDRVPSEESDTRPETNALSLLLERLDPSDLQRISVPLDLVLKAVSPKKR